MAIDTEVKTLIEQTAQTVADIQKRVEAQEADGKTNSEGMEELKGNFDSLTEKLDAIQKASDAEKAAREALELAVARGGQSDGEKHIGSPEYKEAFGNFIRKNVDRIGVDIQEKELDGLARDLGLKNGEALNELKSYIVGSNPDGGFMLPVDIRSNVLMRVAEMSPVRSLATAVTTARDKVAYPVDDDLTNNAYWAYELDDRAETDNAKLGLFEFPTHELYSEPKASNWMLEDATFNLEGFIQEKIARDFARKEATAFISGDGAGEPFGIITYPEVAVETYTRGSIGTQSTGTNDQYDADDFIKLQYHLLEAYQPNASWLINRQTMAGIATLKATDGHYLLNPRVLFEGAQMQLLGKPVSFAPDLAAEDDPTSATDAAKIAIYGDFREGYLIVDRLGITVLRNPYKDPRFVNFQTRRRVGGGVKNFQALKVLKVQ